MNKTSITAVIAIIVVFITVTASFFTIFNQQEEQDYDLDEVMDSVLEISCYKGGSKKTVGTGFVVGADKHVLTNAHLVVIRTSETYEYYDGIKARNANSIQEYDLSIIRYDYENDLALLKISTEKDLEPLMINTERPCYGEKITVIGNALGYGLSVKEGLVSVPEINVYNEETSLNCLMMSLSINHGDSDSPIINGDGEVIGIASFVLKTNDTGSKDMSFAISSKSIAVFLGQP